MLLKQSTARSAVILMVGAADHVTGLASLTLTLTASKDGAAFASIAPTVTDLGNGFYKLALTTAHTDTLGDLALHITGTAADPTDLIYQVVLDLPGIAQTGDNYARLGAPAGASVSADVAAVKADTAAVKTKTDSLTFSVAGVVDANATKWLSGTIPAVNVTGVPLIDLKYTLGTISPATAGSVRTDAVTGAVGSVTGAVGSVTAAVTVGTISAGVITAASIAADAITAAKVADGTIDAATFATGAINAAAIAADAITDAKVASDVTIASVTGAVGSVTGAVGSVTGNVGGNVVGSVASVTAGVTVTTNNDKTGYGLSAAAVQAVWDALTSALTTVGSIGKRIADNLDAAISSRSTFAGGAVASVTADVGITQGAADKVWLSAARTLTSFGTLVADAAAAVWASVTRTLTAGTNIVLAKGTGVTGFNDPTSAATATAVRTELTTELGRIDVAISTRGTGTGTALDAAGVRLAVGLATANLDTQLDALPTAAENAAAIGVVSADVKKVNGVTVTGNGSTLTPWGP